MTDNNRNESTVDGSVRSEVEISFVELINTVLRHRRWVFLLPGLLAVWVATSTLKQPRTYEASASFMPQIGDGRSESAAAGLARQFGVAIGSDRLGQSPQFYASLIRSREVLRRVVEAEYDLVDEEGRSHRATLIDAFELQPTSGVPAWWRAADRLRSSLIVETDRATGLVEVRVVARSPDLAERILERLLDSVHEFNLHTRQIQAKEESRFILERMEEAHAELMRAEAELKRFLQANREFRHSPELTFEHERMQRQVAMRQQIFTSLAQLHEQVRIDAVRDTPLLTMIDQPAGSRRPQGRGGLRRTVLAFVLGTMFTSLAAFFVEFGRRTRQENEDKYLELERLTREAWKDIRRPWRVIPGRTGSSLKARVE